MVLINFSSEEPALPAISKDAARGGAEYVAMVRDARVMPALLTMRMKKSR
jgi:hypothetical protein